VVDAGRAKRRVYDLRSGTSAFEVGWISRASADQRAGRAGRTGPGHCYRLYSSAVFTSQFPAFEEAELLRTPADSVVLTMKSLGIDCVASFPFPSPPKPEALHAAIRSLTNLGALVPVVAGGGGVDAVARGAGGAADGDVGARAAAALKRIVSERLTPLGHALARLPLHPALGKVLVLAGQQQALTPGSRGLLDAAIAMVACMAAQDPFVRPPAAGGRRPAGAAAAGKPAEGGAGDDDNASVVSDEGAMDAALLAEFEAAGGGARDAATSSTGEASGAPVVNAAALAARNAAAAAHAKFRHPLSDALTLLRAAGAHAHALSSGGGEAGAAFCRTYYLRKKSMDEIVKLRRQLHGAAWGAVAAAAAGGGGGGGDAGGEAEAVLAAAAGGDAAEGDGEGGDGDAESAAARPAASRRPAVPPFAVGLAPPTPDTETLLRQLLTAGALERVAKRAPPDRMVSLAAAGVLPRGALPYLPSSSALGDDAVLYVHPGSAVFDPDTGLMPPYVVYTDVVVGKRPYMKGVSVVDAGWLHELAAGTPLCHYGDVLEAPPPAYDAAADRVVAWRPPLFGDHAWKLPPALVLYPTATPAEREARVRLFARAFVEGAVTPELARFAPRLASPSTAITRVAQLKRVVLLVAALTAPPGGSAAVDSALALARVWATHPRWLAMEYKAWLPAELHGAVDAVWPAMQAALARRLLLAASTQQ